MIKANLVFKDEEGKLIPQAVIDGLPTAKFFSMWSKGELRRDIAVTLEDKAAVKKGLSNWESPEFQLVGAEIFEAWKELHQSQLSLVGQCLTHWEGFAGGHAVMRIGDSCDPIIAPEVEEVKCLDASKDLGVSITHYTTYYWLNASVIRDKAWYTRDPEVVVYDMIIGLLKQWTMRDNATLLLLLKQANTINKSESYKDFTPNVLSHMLTQVSKWAIPVPHFIATAEVFAQLDDPDWERFMAGGVDRESHQFLPPDWKNVPQQNLEHGRLLDLSAICIGSPYDAFYPFLKNDNSWPDIYLVGMPASLGVRAIHTQLQSESAEIDALGVKQRGWLWNTYIGTAITNARAVVVGYLNKDVPEVKPYTEPYSKEQFVKQMHLIAKRCHQISKDHGFWPDDEDRNEAEVMALIHGEVSEALEAIRGDNPMSEKIPEFSNLEEECADIIIRTIEYCYAKNICIGEAILAKMEFNDGRPYKHGKRF